MTWARYPLAAPAEACARIGVYSFAARRADGLFAWTRKPLRRRPDDPHGFTDVPLGKSRFFTATAVLNFVLLLRCSPANPPFNNPQRNTSAQVDGALARLTATDDAWWGEQWAEFNLVRIDKGKSV